MKRTVIALTVTAMAVGGAGVASAKSGKNPGNGAQKAGIGAVSATSTPLSNGCKAAEDAGKQTATGFAVLNAPGKPGSPKKIVGEVALKNAEPGTYDLRLATPASDACGEKIGELVVGTNRQGNASVAAASQGVGRYYVTLTKQTLAGLPLAEGLITQEFYASAPVQLR